LSYTEVPVNLLPVESVKVREYLKTLEDLIAEDCSRWKALAGVQANWQVDLVKRKSPGWRRGERCNLNRRRKDKPKKWAREMA
jgi:hypothetical protein